ncbi:phospholipid-transporting ATPase ABCA3 [Drosophila biarmipes]|uniref:phospholipid-transporting ATPase ABCA3 n=1 Tax=Drosophila biarmipes TaxID=125945 RepID=UPI0007E5DB9E|nr:phospholipid-transporting ATPase ABCA3 [Drosophila biarmipes]
MSCKGWHIFWLLVWKNFHKQKSNKLVLFISIVLPVLSALLLLFFCASNDRNLRDYSNKPEAQALELGWSALIDKIDARRKNMVNKQKDFQYNVFIPQIRVAFAPNRYPALRKLIADALGKLSIGKDKIVSYNNCSDLRTHAAAEHYLASVCFRNVDESKSGLPAVMHFAIIMPSELRRYERTWMGDSWKDTHVPVDQDLGTENEGLDEDDFTDYMREGFVALQYYISLEYLQVASKAARLPAIQMRRFDENPSVKLSDGKGTACILMILIGFMFPVAVLVKLIAEEREVGQRFVMEVNNASPTLQIASWFFNSFCQLLLDLSFVTLLLKIQWNGTSAAFNKCPWLVLLFFLISYGLSATSFIICIASLLRKSRIAVVIVPIVWILLPLPFFFDEQLMSNEFHEFYALATAIICNVSFSRGLKKLIYLEAYPVEVPIRKYLMYRVMHSDSGITVPIAYFYLQTFFCILLALILENKTCIWLGRYLKRMCKCCRTSGLHRSLWLMRRRQTIVQEETEPKNEAHASIEFRNVWKRFSTKFVVRSFTLGVHLGEVVALLGHNASGKRTIVRMVYGLIRPTLGEIFLAGYSVLTHKRQALHSSGISLSTQALFTEFTAFDHLIFFCRLRGLTKAEANVEARSYIRYLRIEKWEKSQVKELTVGQKRLLNSLCAFAGRTQIVVLDKPFDGVDELKAELFCGFVQEQKRSRSIFFTTNSPKVASGMADRIAVLSRGKLLTLGTEKRLCKALNEVYRLTLYGTEYCDFKEVHIFLTNFIPDIELDYALGDSAVFLVKRQNQTELMDLLENLSRYKEELNVNSFQLQECSLDNILHNLFSRDQSGFQFGDPETHPFTINREPRRRYIMALAVSLWEVLRQRLLRDIRSCFLPLLKLSLPTWVVLWTLSMPYFWNNCQQPEGILFPITDRGRGIVLMQQNLFEKDLVKACEEYARAGVTQVSPRADIRKYIYSYEYDNSLLSDMDVLEAAIFSDDEIEVLFNNKWHFTAPDGLALVMNSLAIGLIGSDSGIKVELEPLPYSTVHALQLHLSTDGIDLIFATCLSFCFCFLWSLPLLCMALDRNGRYNYVELMAGMRLSTMIVAFLMYDLGLVLLALLPVNVAIVFLQWDVLMDNDVLLLCFYVLVAIALCVLSVNIWISIGVSDTLNGYLMVVTFYSFGIVTYLALTELQPSVDLNTPSLVVLDFHPYYALLHNLMRIASISERIWLCSDRQIYETSVHSERCQKFPNCCDGSAQQFPHFRYLACAYFLTIVVWIWIYICLKSRVVKRRPRQGKYFWDSDPDSQYDQHVLHISQPNDLENTWISEKIRVGTLERNYIESKVLHVEHLSVFFNLKAAIKHIDFMVNRYQVLSVFGANGSGKTVLLKTILGIHSPSSGRIISSKKVPLKSENLEGCNLIGYGAQEVQVFQWLTIWETVLLILRVRRSNRKTLKQDARTLCQIFGLFKYRFQKLSVCSRGTLKRLSLGMALISDAELILLDDPFTHLDVMAQRNVLQVMHELSRRGQSVIYTCSDTQFSTSALRMAALSYPGIAAIGERQEILQNYYTSYYVVETRIHFPELAGLIEFGSLSGESQEEREYGMKSEEPLRFKHHEYSTACNDSEERWKYLQLCLLIEKAFPHAIIKTVSLPKACFWLSSHMYSMSQILKTLDLNKQHFYSFSISQPSVGSTFLTISPQKVHKKSFSY